jgi:hypothetical protein
MVVHACNPSSQEDEAGTQEFKASLVYIARSCSKKRRRKEEEGGKGARRKRGGRGGGRSDSTI